MNRRAGAPTPKTASGSIGPLPPLERAELARQGAKAAARGDSVSSNPMRRPQNAPDVTGESGESWRARCDAWRAGHEQQSETARVGSAWSGDRDDEQY